MRKATVMPFSSPGLALQCSFSIWGITTYNVFEVSQVGEIFMLIMSFKTDFSQNCNRDSTYTGGSKHKKYTQASFIN